MPAFLRKLMNSYPIGVLILFFGSILLFLAAIAAAILLRITVPEVPPEPEFIPLPEVSVPSLPVSMAQLSRLSYTDSSLGELCWDLSPAALMELNRVLLSYDITDPEEICQFLAQSTIETGAGLRLTEAADEDYCLAHGYTVGTRGAGYLHLTHLYAQMAFSTWMMRRYVPELAEIAFVNPANSGADAVADAYYAALQTAANLDVSVSQYSRIVYDPNSSLTTGADYIAECFAWESAAYFWTISGIREELSLLSGLEGVDAVSQRIGGTNLQSRREAYTAFAPVLLGS